VEHRVLVLTPRGRDAEVIRKLLLEQQRVVVLCKDVVSLAHEL
jgi:hypothetical protein